MMAKIKEWLHIKPLSPTKESEVEKQKEEQYQKEIADLTATVKEFTDKAEAEAGAKAKADQEAKDAAVLAADESLKTEVKVFCDEKVAANLMTPAMREKDEPLMYELGKASKDALKSFQEKYVTPIVPLTEIAKNDPVKPDESRLGKAKAYVEKHKADKEFSGLTPEQAVSRAIYLEATSGGKIKF